MSDILKVLAYSNSMSILSFLNNDEGKRFSDISNELQLNPNIVNRRLNDLTEKKLVKKLNNKYSATEKGIRALKVAEKLRNL